jgi:addiction module RelE/StbE family toxin
MKPAVYSNVFANKTFIELYKKADVRLRKSVDEKVQTFKKNPFELGLNNHPLRDKWAGCRSIDITNDYRAVYEEIQEGKELNAYFIALGTHQELYE